MGSRSSSRPRPELERSRTSSPALALTPPRNPEELRSFNIFFVRAVPLLASGNLDAGFWRDTIPRVSQSMPFAWDAAISIGLLYENPVHSIQRRSLVVTPLQPPQFRALQWYSRSVSRLTQQIDGDPSHEMLAIVSSFLFTACEFQQGNSASACALSARAFSLVAAYLAPERLASAVSDTTFMLDQAAVPFMSRHALSFAVVALPELYAFTTEATTSGSETLTPTASDPWSKFKPVAQSLFDLLYRSHEISRAAMLIIDQPHELQWIARLQASLCEQLRAWPERLTKVATSATTPEDLVKISYLQLYHAMATIILETCLEAPQTAFDARIADFASIVDISGTLLSTTHTAPAPFSLNVSPPLFYAATRCRDPFLRRRALALLHAAPPTPQPHVWTALPTWQIATQVVAFEESGAAAAIATNPSTPNGTEGPFRSICGLATPPDASTLIPEVHRVHHVQVTIVPASQAQGGVQARSGARTLALKFVTYTAKREERVHLVSLPSPPPGRTGGSVVSEDE